MDQARKRWSALARDRRTGLSLASDEFEQAATSIDSISLLGSEPGVRHMCTPSPTDWPPQRSIVLDPSHPHQHDVVLPSVPPLPASVTSDSAGSATSATSAGPSPVSADRSRPSAAANVSSSAIPITPTAPSATTAPVDVTPTNSPAVSHPSLSNYSPAPALNLRVDYAELTALKEKFQTLDAEGKGFISRAQFYHLYESIIDPQDDDDEDGQDGSLSSNAPNPMFNFAYNLFVSSGERLNLKEFVTGMTILSNGTEEDRLRYLFMMYDSDNSGNLNAEEIKQVFRIMNSYAASHEFQPTTALERPSLATMRRGNSLQLEELALKTLKEHDIDGDGSIGFEDFAKWCAKDPVVKTWMDLLSSDIARGVARLRGERENDLITRELESLGIVPQNLLMHTPGLQSTPMLPPAIREASMSTHPVIHSDSSGDLDRIANAVGVEHAAHTGRGGGLGGNMMAMQAGVNAGQLPTPSDSAGLSTATIETPPRPSSTTDGPTQTPSFTQTAVDNFEIEFRDLVFEREIGSGSFAVVWKCRWLDSPVAVKVFRSGPQLRLNSDGTPAVASNGSTDGLETGDTDVRMDYRANGESFEPEFDSMASGMAGGQGGGGGGGMTGESGSSRVRFMQEISLLKAIRHPNLLLYMGACVDPAYPLCIVSELIDGGDGGSLFDLLHGPNAVELTIKQKMELVRDIARGMLYLHGRDPIVLHRDLKSANILVERQNEDGLRATIIDFGLSKFGGAQATLGHGRGRGMTGSLVTMAPEVMNEQQYEARSDVYSFGIVCWEIFCGRIPFGQFTGVAQLIMKVAVYNERPEFLPEDRVPQGMQSLISACWHQDVNERPDFLMIASMLKIIRRTLRLQEG